MALFDMPVNELRTYEPPLTREEDFEIFWEATLNESARQPLNLRLEPMETPFNHVRFSRASFAGWAGAPLVGIYAVPEGDGPFPAVALFHGYSGRRPELWELLSWVSQGYAVLATDVRGQGGESGDASGYPGGHAPGFMTMGIGDPQHYYYRGAYVDTVRTIDVLAAQQQVDAHRIGAAGGSQGGALSLVVAALDRRVRAAVAEVPFLCHFRRATTLVNTTPFKEIADYFRRSGADEEQVFRTLSYFDCMNLAPRITVPTLVTVGLMDEVCPPSTIFATYNHISAPKQIFVSTFGVHATFPGVLEARAAWFAKHLT